MISLVTLYDTLVKWTGYVGVSSTAGERRLSRDDTVVLGKSVLSPAKELYDDDRCEVCERTFKRNQDLKAHQTRMHHHVKHLKAVTKTAKEDARHKKMSELQHELSKVKWGQKEADNCWQFCYLGTIFEAGGGQMADVRGRINMAVTRFGKMRNIWKSRVMYLRLRMRLYISSV